MKSDSCALKASGEFLHLLLGRIGDQSFDSKAGTVLNTFDFMTSQPAKKLFLDPSTGIEK